MIGGGARRAALAALVALCASTPAAAVAQDPGTTRVIHNGDYRGLVYEPSSYDAAKPAPLVVFAHGCQTSAEQQFGASLYNALAEREGFVILYPDNTEAHIRQPGPLRRCWRWFNTDSWERDSGDAGAVAGMTRTVLERWRIDPERVYMLGISAGGFMTSIMSSAYPDLYAASVVTAGGAYADPTCFFQSAAGSPVEISAQSARTQMGPRARVVPRMVMGGDVDAAIPPPCSDKALEQALRTNNLVLGGRQDAPLSLEHVEERKVVTPGRYDSTVRTWRDPAGCVIAERWWFHGMGHYWPGGSADPKWDNWTDPKGPNGAEISWAFLKRYTKSSTAMPCAEAPAAEQPTGPPRCAARWVSVRIPKGAKRVRVTVNGRRVGGRVTRTRVRVRLPANRRTVVVRGRTAKGGAFTRRHIDRRCAIA